jgi:hypothetical protein
VALIGAMEAGRALGRWRRHEPELDVGLHARSLVYAGLACLFVNAFFLSTPETFSGPFRVRFPITAYICLAFAYGAYTLWSLLLPRFRCTLPEWISKPTHSPFRKAQGSTSRSCSTGR